jgi:hypothetical protein
MIPPGTRIDAGDRFLALMKWWSEWGTEMFAVQPQLMLSDGEIAGTADVLMHKKDGGPIVADLKNVSQLDPTYNLQLGAYADLYEAQFGVSPAGAGLIHVTQAKDKPVSVKYVEIDLPQARSDWKALRGLWNVVRRVSK